MGVVCKTKVFLRTDYACAAAKHVEVMSDRGPTLLLAVFDKDIHRKNERNQSSIA